MADRPPYLVKQRVMTSAALSAFHTEAEAITDATTKALDRACNMLVVLDRDPSRTDDDVLIGTVVFDWKTWTATWQPAVPPA